MELLTLRVATASQTGLDWRSQRRLALSPVPDVPGLRARWWRAGRRRLTGRYLFDDRDAAEAVRAHPAQADGAIAPLVAGKTVDAAMATIRTANVDRVLDRPIFVLSAPRAGSTMLHELLLRSCRLWSIPGGLQNIIDGTTAVALQAHGYRSHVLDDRDADDATAATLRAAVLAECCSPDGHYWIGSPDPRLMPIRLLETLPENALRIPFLARVFPDARYVFLHRDLRQNVSSLVEAWQRDGFVSIPDLPGWPPGDWCFLLPDGWQRYCDVPPTTLAAFQWAEANRAILQAIEAMPREQWTTVGYDDLVADPVAHARRLCAFVGINPEEFAATGAGLPYSSSTVTLPSPIKWRSNPDFDPDAVKGLQPLAGRIRSLVALPNPPVARESRPTSTRFAIFIDELEPSAVPPGVVVAPSLAPQPGSTVPQGLLRTAGHRERFVGDHPLLWVQDEGTGVWCPLWLRHHQAWLCRHLVPGASPTAALTGRLRGQCYTAGVLVSPRDVVRRRTHGRELVSHAANALKRDRFTSLPGLLNPILTRGVAAYFANMLATEDWPVGDGQVQRRHGWHNERLAQYLHHQLTDIVSQIAARPLKPTYSYTSAYRSGATLDAHTDREQCDYTLSVTIDATAGGGPWALWFHSPSGPRHVEMAVGDGVLFRGCELPHWRGQVAADYEQLNLLFHFVPADWIGVLD